MLIGSSAILRKIIIAGLGLSLLVVAGCGGGGGNSTVTSKSAPVISNVAVVIPDGFSFKGGTVTLNATISDKSQIMEANASVTCPGKSAISKQLGPTGLAHGYAGSIVVPANSSANRTEDVYTVVVKAVNDKNKEGTSSSVTFRVPAPPSPPDPPM